MGKSAIPCFSRSPCARPATRAPPSRTDSVGSGDTPVTPPPKLSGEFDPEHHEESFSPSGPAVGRTFFNMPTMRATPV